MTNEQKTNWIEALKSGKYKQTQGALQRDGKYCCLGVLQKITGCKLRTTLNGSDSSSIIDDEFLSLIVQGELIKFNDCDKKSFTEIADWIEKNL